MLEINLFSLLVVSVFCRIFVVSLHSFADVLFSVSIVYMNTYFHLATNFAQSIMHNNLLNANLN